MSKKKLLNEETIRQFMKYADIGHLTENYLDEGDMYEEEEEIEVAGEELPPEAGEELPMDAEEAPLDDAPVDDLAGEEEAMADTSEASVEALVDALADTITQVTGVEVTAAGEGDELPAEEPEADFAPADELAGDELAGDELAGDELAGDEGPADEEVLDEDGIVNETMKRVMVRLQEMKKENAKAKKHEELIEAVATAVEKRLASK